MYGGTSMIIYKLIQLIMQLFGYQDDSEKESTGDQIVLISSSNSCKVPTSGRHFSFKRIYEENEIL